MRTIIKTCLAICTLSFVACADDAIEDIDESGDCDVICDTYADCFDEGYDRERCYDRCTDRADDMSARDQEDQCESCIDDLSCGEAVFSCTDDCIGIVP
jgi:hypothetical protein